MTQGNLAGALVRFSLPLIFSGLLQQLYNWADAFIVGNVEGELALTAIGATGMIINLFVFVITGFTQGLSILAAQQYGGGETADLSKILSAFAVTLGGALTVLGCLGGLLSGQVLELLNTPADIFSIARGYLRIILPGMPLLAVYNVYAAVLRGIGDSRAPFLAVILSSGANVLLDILLVAALRMGADGAAAATVISQGLMAVFIICYSVRKYPMLRFSPRENMVDREILRQGCALGVPPAIQSSVSSLGSLILQNFMNGFGTRTVAAITTAYRVDSVIMLPIINLGSGISTVTAQNLGAGNRKRANRVLAVGTALMMAVAVCLTMLVRSFGGDLIAMFGVTQASVRIGTEFFRCIAWFYVVYGVAMSFRGFLEGTGDVLFSSAAGMLALLVRIIASYGLAEYWGNMVIAYAEVFSWGALVLLYLPRLLWKRRMLRKAPEEEPANQ